MPRTASSSSQILRFGLIGYPAAHSLSPELFREFCDGIWEYDIIETPSFDDAWGRFVNGPYKAVNVTAPFKEDAFQRADIKSPECLRIKAANILVKTPDGIAAYNSDYLAVRSLLDDCRGFASIAIVGFGGAGKAAFAAAEDFLSEHSTSGTSQSGCGIPCPPVKNVQIYHHDELADGVKADIIIFTLPKSVPGIEKLDCSVLIEANYKDPCLSPDLFSTRPSSQNKYIPGIEWLQIQAELGFPLMIG